jgi:hypothetical protein
MGHLYHGYVSHNQRVNGEINLAGRFPVVSFAIHMPQKSLPELAGG